MSTTTLISPSVADPPVASTGPLADLILVRLLPAKKSIGIKEIVKAVSELYESPPSAQQYDEVIAQLRAVGLIAARGQLLTDAGRTRALAYLGIAELPTKANWGTVKAKYLVPKALRLSPQSQADSKTFSKADKLALLLLKRKLGLPVGTGNTLNAVFEAIACRELGYPDHARFKEVIPHLLGKAIGSSEPIATKDAKKLVPRVLLDASKAGIDGLRAVALVGLTATTTEKPIAKPTQPIVPPPQPIAKIEPFDLETFANTVKSVARKSPSGWFGDNKVFINHVWRQVKDEPQFAPLGLAGFKDKLVQANRENLLTLSRADLVQVMDPTDVSESEAAYLNALFHFILVEKQ